MFDGCNSNHQVVERQGIAAWLWRNPPARLEFFVTHLAGLYHLESPRLRMELERGTVGVSSSHMQRGEAVCASSAGKRREEVVQSIRGYDIVIGKDLGGLAVGVFAILHAIDTQSVGIRIGKTDTPLAYPEAIFWRVNTLKLFDIARSCDAQTLDGGCYS